MFERLQNENYKKVIKMFVENYTIDDSITPEEIKKFIKKDCESLIDLRNRLNEAENTTEFFEEDYLTCDHILDYMEIFMELIGV